MHHQIFIRNLLSWDRPLVYVFVDRTKVEELVEYTQRKWGKCNRVEVLYKGTQLKPSDLLSTLGILDEDVVDVKRWYNPLHATIFNESALTPPLPAQPWSIVMGVKKGAVVEKGSLTFFLLRHNLVVCEHHAVLADRWQLGTTDNIITEAMPGDRYKVRWMGSTELSIRDFTVEVRFHCDDLETGNPPGEGREKGVGAACSDS
eukprot:Sspe_Gene.43569::Locus_21242_Transcript_1_1_Confidence_1.000_Length_775::g.43569::m.43569